MPALRTTRLAALGALVAALGLGAAAPVDAARDPAVDVWFLRAGTLVAAERTVSGIPAAVDALLRGPTARERARGLRSAVPAGTRVRSISVRRRVVTIDLDARFATGRDRTALAARAGQLIRTVGGVPGVRAVRVLVEGGVPIGLFPGLDLRRALTVAAVPTGPERGPRAVQEQLRDLGFLAPNGVTGAIDEQTGVAILAFQKWARLERTGVLDESTARALWRAQRPGPQTAAAGRRIEVLLDRQLALLVEGARVDRVVHISSGAYGRTPAGSFRVFRKERMSWSVPFSVWLPWASYFVGGIAFHEYADVPAYPASHGCVRVNRFDAPRLYEFAVSGTPVTVLAVSA